VSNDAVGRFRSLRKVLIALGLSLCAVLFLTLLASQIEHRLFRRRAEILLSKVQALELRKTSWQDAQVQLQQWGPNRVLDDSGDLHMCSLQVTLDEFVFARFIQRNPFAKLDDYFRWRLKLTYNQGPFERMQASLVQAYVRLGGHPARVMAKIGMRDGLVWSKGFYVWIETYGHPTGWSGNWLMEFTLIASANSVSRFDRPFVGWNDAQLMLHPYYWIGRLNCTICVEGRARFTPYAEPADVHRLMQLDLSCLTRWGHCRTQSDLMPAAWAQYLAERPIVDGSRGDLSCSPSSLEILGRDSAKIVIVEMLKRRDNLGHPGLKVARVRVVQRLRGIADWKIGETREIRVWGDNDGEGLNALAGKQSVLFRGSGPSTEAWTISLPTCPSAWVNETNLKLIARGIDQDYGALDESE
jgi:hypothetical protein